MKPNKLFVCSLSAISFVLAGNAQLVVYEPFNQTTGSSIGGTSGGTGLGSWQVGGGTATTENQSLNYGELANEGNQLRMLTSGGTDAFVTTTSALADNGLLDNGSSMWFSFAYTKLDGNFSNEKAGFAFGTDRIDGAFDGSNMTNGGSGFGVRALLQGLRAAAWSGGGQPAEEGSNHSYFSSYGETVFVVGELVWGADLASDDTLNLYNPPVNDLATLGSAVSSVSLGNIDQTAFDTISMTVRNADGDQIYDELRFGATYDDVSPVPEPSAFALLAGMFGLTWVMLRRR